MKLTISNFKEVMTTKAIKKGSTWENFGQKELNQLRESSDNKNNDTKIKELSEWASNFTLFED